MYTHEYVTDNQIIDLYVMERLAPDEKARFEDHFFSCATCLEDLEITRSFHASMKDHVVENLEKTARVNLMAILLGVGMKRTLSVALTMAVAFLGFQTYLNSTRLEVRKQPHLTTSMTLDMVRSEMVYQLITLSPGQDQLRFVQPILSSYLNSSVLLLNEKGVTLLKMKADQQGKQLSLDLPASFLEPGRYQLRIEGQIGDRVELFGVYGFELRKE